MQPYIHPLDGSSIFKSHENILMKVNSSFREKGIDDLRENWDASHI